MTSQWNLQPFLGLNTFITAHLDKIQFYLIIWMAFILSDHFLCNKYVKAITIFCTKDFKHVKIGLSDVCFSRNKQFYQSRCFISKIRKTISMFPFVQNHDVVPIVMIECVTLQEKKKRKKKKNRKQRRGTISKTITSQNQ